MKKNILLTAIINLICLTACSSETATKTGNQANANSTNANVITVQAENSNLAPVNEDANLNANMYKKRPITNVSSDVKMPGAVEDPGVPAPFNSAIRSTMSKQNKFLEIRTFKGDPLLLRVEREQESKKVRAYLKNGKVLEVPYEKGEKLFLTASPNEILAAAGVTPPAVKPAASDDKKNNDPTKKQ